MINLNLKIVVKEQIYILEYITDKTKKAFFNDV